MSTTAVGPLTPRWPRSTRILFRFACCYALLYYSADLLRHIPGIPWLLAYPSRLWYQFLGILGVGLFHVDYAASYPHRTGSGDTALAWLSQFATILVALAATTLWSMLEHTRLNRTHLNHQYSAYPRLAAWLTVFARYSLALALFTYAWIKIIPTQFSHLQAHALAEPYGQSTPMALLWNFIGFSTAYTVFGGLAELLPAVLLCFRRTAPLGALVATGVLLNIVLLNFCYDVPVKLYSLNLLALAIALTLPHRHTFLRFFTGRPARIRVQPLPLPQRLSTPRALRLLTICKYTVLLLFIAQCVTSGILAHLYSFQPDPPPTPLTTRGFHWVQEYPINH